MKVEEEFPYDDFPLTLLDEMLNLKKKDSGLPVNIWLDSARVYKRGGHGKRIKVQNDHGNNMNPNNLFSMTISDDPKIVPLQAAYSVKIPDKEVEQVIRFVKNNKDLLSQLADEKITEFDFYQRMRK